MMMRMRIPKLRLCVKLQDESTIEPPTSALLLATDMCLCHQPNLHLTVPLLQRRSGCVVSYCFCGRKAHLDLSRNRHAPIPSSGAPALSHAVHHYFITMTSTTTASIPTTPTTTTATTTIMIDIFTCTTFITPTTTTLINYKSPHQTLFPSQSL